MDASTVSAAGGTPQSSDPLSQALGTARALHQFMNLGVAQLDAALRESDAQVEKVAQCLAELSHDVQQLEALATAPAAETSGALAASLRDTLQNAVKALQFYDKLIQRLTHVRAGLAIPADATSDTAAAHGIAWGNILEQVRSRYSMVEERVLFDFMMRGLRAEQMLKALQSLREGATPGELELF